ncbi:hypothetical protein EVAR_5283_1 [Eumeta japonica]|uniref:Uncharacterized protein n=1 Tax=Eumeta variegata TaxID=151549 RepID=A0A4C1TM43_EUMVA|nr:hypothetical protein EVAR_5283_1 [Eumeta japonica]
MGKKKKNGHRSGSRFFRWIRRLSSRHFLCPHSVNSLEVVTDRTSVIKIRHNFAVSRDRDEDHKIPQIVSPTIYYNARATELLSASFQFAVGK